MMKTRRLIRKLQGGGNTKKPDYTGMGIGFMNNPEKYKAAFHEDFPKYIGGMAPAESIVGGPMKLMKALAAAKSTKALPVIGTRSMKILDPNESPQKIYRGITESIRKNTRPEDLLDNTNNHLRSLETVPGSFTSSDINISKGFAYPGSGHVRGILNEYKVKRPIAAVDEDTALEFLKNKRGQRFSVDHDANLLKKEGIDAVYTDAFGEKQYQFLNNDLLELNKSTMRKFKGYPVGIDEFDEIPIRKYGGKLNNTQMKNTGDPKRPKTGSSYSVIANRFKHPLTDRNVMDRMIELGYHNDLGALSKMTPTERQALIPSDSPLSFDRSMKRGRYGTANQEGFKYYDESKRVTGRTLKTPDGKTINNPTADILDEYGYDPEKYDLGGWLKGNIGNIAKTGIGGLMMATGVGAPIGAGLLASGASGMIGSMGSGMGEGDGENEISQSYNPAVSKSRQLYDTAVAANGGNLKRLSKRTDYRGQSHANGGINIGIAEVEDGESRTGDIVHSEKIKITPGIMKAYGGKVPFKKGDLGKSVSSLVKRSDKRFEKRSGDEWNDQARKVSQLPFEEMSDELSQMYDLGIDFVPDNKADGGFLGNAWDKSKDFLNDPGNAPIVGSALGLITNTLRKPEKVKYDRAKFTPTNFTPMNTEASIGAIKRSFGDTKERLRRLNPRGYMNNLASLGAAEAETIGDSVSRIGLGNTENMNRASMMDSQNRSRLSMFNSQVGMQEAEANAANRSARRSAIDMNLNNMFTQIGQKGRDDKSYAMQEKNQQDYMDLQNKYLEIWNDSKNKGTMDFGYPGDEIMNPFNPAEDDPNKMYGEFGGNILPKTTALLSKRRYRTY